MNGKNLKIFLSIIILCLVSFTTLSNAENSLKNNSNLFDFSRSHNNPIYIDGNDGFTAENGISSGNGTSKNPFIIENLDIKISLKDIFTGINGISIKNTNAYFVINNCFVHFIDGKLANIVTKIRKFYGSMGISLHNVSNVKITNCFIQGMQGAINIENNSHKNIVLNCSCWRNYCGIGINRNSSNNSIKGCKTRNYGCGICLWDNTSYNSIKNCTCRNVGINIYKSSNNLVSRCNLSYCLRYSSMNIFDESCNNTVENCTFNYNKNALKIFDCSNNNLMYSNNFMNNLKAAYDECNNQWDNGTIGNYWHYFKDIDENMDGIWDNEKSIEGGTSLDRFPLVYPSK